MKGIITDKFFALSEEKMLFNAKKNEWMKREPVRSAATLFSDAALYYARNKEQV